MSWPSYDTFKTELDNWRARFPVQQLLTQPPDRETSLDRIARLYAIAEAFVQNLRDELGLWQKSFSFASFFHPSPPPFFFVTKFF